MSELTVFLEARLAEDADVARAAFMSDRDGDGDSHWRAHRQKSLIPGHLARWQVVSVAESWEDPGFPAERIVEAFIGGGNEEERPVAEFVARHDPARVLVEVEAKRAIVALVEMPAAYASSTGGGRMARMTLRLLASVYADHEDYQEGWAL